MGTVYVVGLGPGGKAYRTHEADAALINADVLCGYHVYTDLVRDEYPDKPVLTTPMKQEIDRCKMALEEAQKGKTVAMVCSGDAGVYGMAGLLFELGVDMPEVEIEVVPGITAALSGGAVLGAPLTNDFAVISLSNLLTPWDVIEKRLHAVGAGDFVVAIYNPSSKRRADHLEKACKILREYRGPETVCGFVRNIGRDGEEYTIVSLEELEHTTVDMFTTVFIGNSDTKIINGKMVTSRGYQKKYE